MKSAKIIDVSQASLVSLKAELSRKQEEVSRAKADAQASYIHPAPRPRKEPEKSKRDGESEIIEKDVEEIRQDEELHRKSRNALEAKAKLYEKLAGSGTQDDEDSPYLVDFQQKSAEAQREKRHEEEEVEEQYDSDEYEAPSDPEDDWVDYTDCLGRTRRCLRRDLDFVKDKDIQLAQSLGFVVDREGSSDPGPVAEATVPLNAQLMSSDLRREELRRKWEQQEDVLKDKKDIHYQDVLFDEARTHGVGYFAFSQEEETRRQQQEALARLRQETRRQQQTAKDVRKRRQAALQARVRAARNRQRARLGLPPEPDEPESEEPSGEATAAEEAAKQVAQEEADRLAKEQETIKKAQTLRPWDVGKERKPSQVMSQEDWVKKKRTERIDEFAPPKQYRREKATSCSVRTSSLVVEEPVEDIGPPVPDPAWSVPDKSKGALYFSTKKTKPKPHRTNNDDVGPSVPDWVLNIDFSKPPPSTAKHPIREVHPMSEEPTQQVPPQKKLKKIHNEVSNPIEVSSDEEDESCVEKRGKGVEIAPPTTYEYYGPTKGTQKNQDPQRKMVEIEESISAGLKFLRQQQEEKEKHREKGLLDIV